MTRYKPVVGVSEAVSVVFIFISSKIFLSYAVFLYDTGMNGAWLIPPVQTAVGLGAVLLLATVLNRYPGRDLVQAGEEATGPYLNIMFSLFYLVVIVFYAGLSLRATGEWAVSVFLQDTPISVVTLVFMLSSLVVSYLGFEAVARSARFLVPVLIISVVFMVLLSIPYWQFHTLYPLWGAGPAGIFKGALEYTGDFAQVLLLGIIVPFLPAGSARTVGLWGVAVAGFFMFLYVLASLVVFTYPVVAELSLPSFEIARIISIGRFGQRMELFFVPVWAFTNLITLSVAQYAGAAVLARLSGLGDYRPFVLAVTVLIITTAFIPQNVSQTIWWNQYLSRYGLAVLVAIWLIILLASRVGGKGGKTGEKNP